MRYERIDNDQSYIGHHRSIFGNIGLGSWVYFCVRGLTSSKSRELRNFLEHLKFFPYVEMFYNLEAGTVIASVNIPPSWTNAFIFRLTTLYKLHPECSHCGSSAGNARSDELDAPKGQPQQ